jgi:hypothetical protein
VGTDIVGGAPAPAFNAAFTLNNASLPFQSTTLQLPQGIGVRLTVRLPAAGRVTALDAEPGKRGSKGHTSAWFNAVTATTSHAGVVHLKIVPNATGRRQLSRKRSIHVLVKEIVTLAGARPSTRTIGVTWHR